MAARRQVKKKHPEVKLTLDKKVFDFNATQEDPKKELSGSEDDVREGKVSFSTCLLVN